MRFENTAVQITPPGGYMEPLPIPLGVGRKPNDMRIVFVTAGGSSDGATLDMKMNPDPPTAFSTAYALTPGIETHGVYYRRLAVGDTDDVSVAWAKPSGWQYFMYANLTALGVSATVAPTGGWLRVNQTGGDTTAVAQSVTVPGPGVMLFFVGTVATPWAASGAPTWPVSLGVPTGWTHVVATDKSGKNFYQYANDPSLVVVAKSYTSAGSTGAVSFPTSQGQPAFNGLYMFLTAAVGVSATIGAA